MTTLDKNRRRSSARAAFWRRLGRQAALGAAGTAGSGIVTLAVWWLTSR
ncbi:hypothetical protein [Streptomyces triticiradicis]|nr:hypothetical protein [Streptomyces triticiradicis]